MSSREVSPPSERVVRCKRGLVLAEVAVDLGTSATRLVVRGSDVLVEEPTVAAVEQQSGHVVEIGQAAERMVESAADERYQLVWPLRHGVVDDAVVLARLLARLSRRVPSRFFERTRLLLTVPSAATAIERRTLREAARRAGASTVHLVEQVMAIALGAGLPVHEPAGTMVVSVGAGVTEAAALSLGTIVATSSARLGGADVDVEVKSMLRREYGIVVDDRMAESIKLAAAELYLGRSDQLVEAVGTSLADDQIVTAILECDELQPALDRLVHSTVEVVRTCLVEAPPEVAQDLIGRGIHLAGGSAQLPGLGATLARELMLPVHLLAQPAYVASAGAGKCLEAMDDLRDVFV